MGFDDSPAQEYADSDFWKMPDPYDSPPVEPYIATHSSFTFLIQLLFYLLLLLFGLFLFSTVVEYTGLLQKARRRPRTDVNRQPSSASRTSGYRIRWRTDGPPADTIP